MVTVIADEPPVVLAGNTAVAPPAAIDAENAMSVLYAGMFPSLIAPLLWMVAVQALGPNRTSIFMNLMPVFTAIIAYFWLHEDWTVYHTIGGIIILVGIALAQKKSHSVKKSKSISAS